VDACCFEAVRNTSRQHWVGAVVPGLQSKISEVSSKQELREALERFEALLGQSKTAVRLSGNACLRTALASYLVRCHCELRLAAFKRWGVVVIVNPTS
jgi:hypothetical protein